MKNLSRFLALSTILTSIAGATIPTPIESDRDEAMRAGKHYSSSKSGQDKSLQTQWWNEFENSKTTIVQYVHEISVTKPEAAIWFLLTGGKNGFSSRTATDEEVKTMKESMHKIASFMQNKQTTDKDWKASISKYDEDHQHVKVLYFMVNELNEKVKNLETDLILMKKDLLNVNKELSDLKLSTATMRMDLLSANEDLRQQTQQLFSMIKADQERRDVTALEVARIAAEERRVFADEMKILREQNSGLLKMMNDLRSESAEKVETLFQQSIAREQQDRLASEARFIQLSNQMEQARLASEADSRRRDDESRKQIQELMALLAAKNGGGNSRISSLSGFPGGFANYDINSEVSSLASTGTSVGGIPGASFLNIGEMLANGSSHNVSVASSSGSFIERDLRFSLGIPPRDASLPMSGSVSDADDFVVV
jgi:hypothetical protein